MSDTPGGQEQAGILRGGSTTFQSFRQQQLQTNYVAPNPILYCNGVCGHSGIPRLSSDFATACDIPRNNRFPSKTSYGTCDTPSNKSITLFSDDLSNQRPARFNNRGGSTGKKAGAGR